jgi:Spy/CpxP family protein refolding chaperone
MRLGKLAMVLAAGIVLGGMAAAQLPGGGQPGGFGGGFGGFGGGGGLAGMIAQSKQLQEELKIEIEQIDKLTAALTKVREDLRDEMAKLRDRNTSPENRAEIMKKLGEANAKAIDFVLKPDQVKRLHQIENQQAGVGMFNKDDVQKALKLSDGQKDKIKSINEDLQKEMRELSGGGPGGGGGRGGAGGPGGGRGGFDPEAQKKRQGLQKEAMDNILKVLDDSQKGAVKDLTGAAFELRFEGFGAGGFGGGAGGPGGFGGGFGGFPQPGQIMAPFLQQQLKLTDEQKKQLEDLQKEVDGKLDKLLTDEQRKQLKDMREGVGRGGFGGRGGPGGGPPPGN